MKSSHFLQKILGVVTVVLFAGVAIFGSQLTSVAPAFAVTSVSDLQKQQKALQEKAAQALEQAKQQKALAERAAASLAQATKQIQVVGAAIRDTQQKSLTVQQQIAEATQQIAEQEAELNRIQSQQDALVRQMYILKQSQPDSLQAFSGKDVSDVVLKQQQFNSISNVVKMTYVRTAEQKVAIENNREALLARSNVLADLQDQQVGQKKVLANVQQTQSSLKKNATAAQADLEAAAAAAQQEALKIAAKIATLTRTKSWGDQIVSSNDYGWYYMQTGDDTRMGDSPYTISQVGCLITSIAMVAKYYGNSVTPGYIARNGIFSNGYLVSLPDGLGVTVQGSQSINWGVVNNELANDRPVIVSIYLSSVGAVNRDGSSHFIVIKGFKDGKYLMHDPIGDGRGYNLNQVRSMKLVNG